MKIPNRALNQYDLLKYVNKLKIINFKGVFMRDTLPKYTKNIECGILNLDSIKGPGTHWTCWYRFNDKCYYFDSFGLSPPNEFYKYMKCDIIHSTYQIQEMGDIICGHLCLLVLKDLTVSNLDFHKIIFKYYSLEK